LTVHYKLVTGDSLCTETLTSSLMGLLGKCIKYNHVCHIFLSSWLTDNDSTNYSRLQSQLSVLHL